MASLPRFLVNLDEIPSRRWSEVIPVYKTHLVNAIDKLWSEFADTAPEQDALEGEEEGGKASEEQKSHHNVFAEQVTEGIFEGLNEAGAGYLVEELKAIATLAEVVLLISFVFWFVVFLYLFAILGSIL